MVEFLLITLFDIHKFMKIFIKIIKAVEIWHTENTWAFLIICYWFILHDSHAIYFSIVCTKKEIREKKSEINFDISATVKT